MSERNRGSLSTWWTARPRWQKVGLIAVGVLIALTGLGSLVEDQSEVQTSSASRNEVSSTTSLANVTTLSTADALETSTTGAASTTVVATTTTQLPTTTTPLPNYKVLATEDVSFPGAMRLSLRVVVDEGTTREQLRVIAKRIVADQQEKGAFQALLIFFYHYPELTQDIAALGAWEYAPYGDWGRADEVELGDYTKHEPNDRTKEKDWSLLPSRDEIDVYVAYIEMFTKMDTDPLSSPADDDIYPAVATELAIPVNEVDAALDAIADWWFNEE